MATEPARIKLIIHTYALEIHIQIKGRRDDRNNQAEETDNEESTTQYLLWEFCIVFDRMNIGI